MHASRRLAENVQDIGLRPAVQSLKELVKFRGIGGIEAIVGIDPENVIAGGMPQRLIACGRKVVDPLELDHLRAQVVRDLLGAIGRAGVDDDHFAEHRPQDLDAGSQVSGLIADDHAQRNAVAELGRS